MGDNLSSSGGSSSSSSSGLSSYSSSSHSVSFSKKTTSHSGTEIDKMDDLHDDVKPILNLYPKVEADSVQINEDYKVWRMILSWIVVMNCIQSFL